MTANWRVTIAKYGERSTTKSDVYLNHHITGQADDPIGMDYFVWVLQRPGRTIVVDTGFSAAGGAARRRTFVAEPARIFAALGVDPATAPTVVVTHAHYDHIGNLPLFPDSDIVIAAAELEFWTSAMGRRAQFAHSVEEDEIAHLAAAHAAGRVRTFDDELELDAGVRVIRVGGHTPGQSILLVDTDEGTALIGSDAVHYYEELDEDMPFAFVAELPAMYAGFDRIAAMLEDGTAAHLVSGHDPETLARFRMIEEGPLAGLAATIGSIETSTTDTTSTTRTTSTTDTTSTTEAHA
jgi:glyoxylase-like metal-dependent hydrolase (beta-lactamase superfamily II)